MLQRAHGQIARVQLERKVVEQFTKAGAICGQVRGYKVRGFAKASEDAVGEVFLEFGTHV